MSKYQLPENCSIEMMEHSCRDRAFRLRFQNETGGIDDYVSEVYYPEKGQRTKAAAWEICQRYGWHEFPPSTGILTREELLKLQSMVDEAIHDMDANPERYVPDPEAAWDDLFSYTEGEFYSSGDDFLMCGDPPVPEPDCDMESGWTAYNYTHSFARYIPHAVAAAEVTKGPRGIETITFHSGDCDGNWEVEAYFCRIQPGAEITEKDRERVQETAVALEKAREAYDKARADGAGYGDVYRAWVAASDAHKIASDLKCGGDLEEECWDPEDFRYYAIQMNCYWTCLRYTRYQIWCAIHGEDPRDNVMPESEEVEAVFDVTARMRKGGTETTAELVSGQEDLRKEAIAYLGGHTVEELKAILKEHPEGRSMKDDSWGRIRMGWEPAGVTLTSVTFRVFMKGHRMVPVDAKRIRQVSCRGLEEDVKRMLHRIDKQYPKSK